jgi:hypothetical protein
MSNHYSCLYFLPTFFHVLLPTNLSSAKLKRKLQGVFAKEVPWAGAGARIVSVHG